MAIKPAQGGFAGIPPDGFAFLGELAAHQDKAWFEANKPRHERALRTPIASLVVGLAEAFAARDLPLTGDPKRSMYRIHRDTRFSNDKTPYKTHAGMVLFRPGGDKTSPGVLYVHVEPRACFVAAAFYRPEPDVLSALRAGIQARPEAFLAVADALASQGLAIEGESLTRMPRGFEGLAGGALEPYVKLKSFLVRRALTQTQLGAPGAIGLIADFAADALPLLRFGWTATDAARGLDQAGRLAKFLPTG